ncbi:TVP38/TMEM64 family protein [Romboutsia weinsteinii]|uniref:TVP38/TMEM64 family membrane protein n=1 Tax=Romboutsia weinsteinii TaxID=2020949 RepID=A0A371J0U9_9FIRM|nr:TVP38/TMEM64 family protein [Romboutsia weinsteinii]
MVKKNNKNTLKLIIGVLFLIIVIIAICKICSLNLGIDDIKGYVDSFGKFAPIVYIIMFALIPLTLFPDSILAIAGGLVFGLFRGYIYTTIGALIGGTISFFISRYWGRDVVKKLTKEKLDKIENMINNRGFVIVFLLRLIPLFPFDVISYGSGLTSIKYKDFLLATFFGTIPGILVFTNLGAESVNIGSNSFYLSISALILLFIVSIFLKNKFILNNLIDDSNN